jgi:hypothetical protein
VRHQGDVELGEGVAGSGSVVDVAGMQDGAVPSANQGCPSIGPREVFTRIASSSFGEVGRPEVAACAIR